jgi:DNA polymerase-3 subunit epsilon
MKRSTKASPGQLSLDYPDSTGFSPSAIQPEVPKKRKPNAPTTLSTEQMTEALRATGEYRILKGWQHHEVFSEQTPTKQRIGLFVDCETTGLAADDKMIQIGLVRFSYDDNSGVILRLEDPVQGYSAFEDPTLEDPKKELSEEIIQLTGITHDDVRDQKFNEYDVKVMLEGVDLVIAHNAAFDRPRFEERFPFFADVDWACSFKDVIWKDFEIPSAKLDYLAYMFGFYFSGHQALADCFAGLEVLSMTKTIVDKPEHTSTKPVMKYLLENCRTTKWRHFVNPDRGQNDRFRARGYRWCGKERASSWYKDYDDEESARKAQDVITKAGIATGQQTRPITARDRYSKREMGNA